ncbi:MAG: hypothetical protein IT434_06160 [Phycisphaerales bacterium]|jgi:hypothetical protein|nr:hypothetical protein [Phycisphaerales bacterium]
MTHRNLTIAAVFCACGSALADVHVTSVNVSANVNGSPFTITGNASYSQSVPSDVTNEFTYSSIPDGYHAFVIITIFNTWKCSAMDGAVNLADATGGGFTLNRSVSIFDGATNVGSFLISGTVHETGPLTGVADLTLTGDYSGPLDLVGASGYHQLLQQAGPNEIHGAFTQFLNRSGGSPLSAEVQNTWTYTAGPGLPGDEYSILEISSLTYDDASGVLNLTGSGWYEIPAPASAFLLGLVGLLMSRRHR